MGQIVYKNHKLFTSSRSSDSCPREGATLTGPARGCTVAQRVREPVDFDAWVDKDLLPQGSVELDDLLAQVGIKHEALAQLTHPDPLCVTSASTLAKGSHSVAAVNLKHVKSSRLSCTFCLYISKFKVQKGV